jgi:hypothetical protein
MRTNTNMRTNKDTIWNVYFTDSYYDHAVMKGTKTQIIKSAKLYIRQWQLDAKLERIEAVHERKVFYFN